MRPKLHDLYTRHQWLKGIGQLQNRESNSVGQLVCVCGCYYTQQQGIRSRCTIQLLPKTIAIVCRLGVELASKKYTSSVKKKYSIKWMNGKSTSLETNRCLSEALCVYFSSYKTLMGKTVAQWHSVHPVKSIFQILLALFIIPAFCGYNYHQLASPQASWVGIQHHSCATLPM